MRLIKCDIICALRHFKRLRGTSALNIITFKLCTGITKPFLKQQTFFLSLHMLRTVPGDQELCLGAIFNRESDVISSTDENVRDETLCGRPQTPAT